MPESQQNEEDERGPQRGGIFDDHEHAPLVSQWTIFNIVDYNHYCDKVKRMDEQTSRRYHSPRRAQQAEATREAIVRAARALFGRDGYQAATLQAIAQEGGVAVATIYATFGSKAAILSALIKSAGADADIRALAEKAIAEREPRRQLRLAAKVMCAIMERESDIMNLLWQAGSGDPDLAAAWRQSHQQRLNRLAPLIESLAQQGALKSGLSVQEATDIAFTLSSPETHRLLRHERGWSPQRFEDWLADSFVELLLGAP